MVRNIGAVVLCAPTASDQAQCPARGEIKYMLTMGVVTRKLRIFYNWIRGYSFGDPARNGEYHFARSYISDGMIVFDVGAHVGDYTDYILSLGKNVEIHCFEPVDSVFQKLKERFDNRAKNEGVFLNAVGLSDKPEIATMKIYGDLIASNSLYESVSTDNHLCGASFHEAAIKLITIDEYMDEKEVDHIDMLKIDVEGHELGVLQGASRALAAGKIACIQFEYCIWFKDAGITLEQVYILLSRYKYTLFRLMPFGKICVSKFKPSLENYQFSNWVALRT